MGMDLEVYCFLDMYKTKKLFHLNQMYALSNNILFINVFLAKAVYCIKLLILCKKARYY